MVYAQTYRPINNPGTTFCLFDFCFCFENDHNKSHHYSIIKDAFQDAFLFQRGQSGKKNFSKKKKILSLTIISKIEYNFPKKFSKQNLLSFFHIALIILFVN